ARQLAVEADVVRCARHGSHRTTKARELIARKWIADGCRVERDLHRAAARCERHIEARIRNALNPRLIEQSEPRPRSLAHEARTDTARGFESNCGLPHRSARPAHRSALLRAVAILESLAVELQGEARHRGVE